MDTATTDTAPSDTPVDDTGTDLRVDPRLFALPPDPVPPASDREDVAAALRASGLAHEIDAQADAAAKALPWTPATVRGGTITWGRDRVDEHIRHLSWPEGLYIPRGAESRDYWITEAPAKNRYALAWPARNSGDPAWADADSGELLAYASVPFTDPARDPRSEAGIGIRYTPAFSLGTIDVTPAVELRDGMLTAALEYFPIVSAGGVTLTASVVIAMWQVIPGGFDLVDYGVTPIARITRDQSFGPTREPLPGTLYRPQPFSHRFLVQGARDYVIGVIGRVEIASTLSDDRGGPLTRLDNRHFTVYAYEKLHLPSIQVETRTVYLP